MTTNEALYRLIDAIPERELDRDAELGEQLDRRGAQPEQVDLLA